MEKLKLFKIPYSVSSDGSTYFVYNYEGGVVMVREYVSPLARLGADVLIFKMPLFETRFFIWELIGIILTVAYGVISIISICKLVFAENHPVDTSIPIVCSRFAGFAVLSFYGSTILLAQILTFYRGKSITGIVVYVEDYQNAGADSKSKYTVKIAEGQRVILKDFLPKTFYEGEDVKLKIHPDNIPYAIHDYWFTIHFFFIAIVLIGGSLVYMCIKEIL